MPEMEQMKDRHQIFESLRNAILSGKYPPLAKIPSETALSNRFGVGRMTIRRVLQDLHGLGLIASRQGKGTFVTRALSSRKIGVIVPGMAYSEYFPRVVSCISQLAQSEGYMMLFGDMPSQRAETRARQTISFARSLVDNGVSGVIFQPLEFFSEANRSNEEVVSVFKANGIPVVLLDCDINLAPMRSGYDVVGINNVRAGMELASHLLSLGLRRIHFLELRDWNPSGRERLRGVIDMMNESGVPWSDRNLIRAAADDKVGIARHIRRWKPEAIICSYDLAAAKLCQTLKKVGVRVPEDIRLAGFDDVQCAVVMTPQLTTIHQPSSQIAEAAFRRLLVRIKNPGTPAQDIYLPAPLVVRESTTGV